MYHKTTVKSTQLHGKSGPLTDPTAQMSLLELASSKFENDRTYVKVLVGNRKGNTIYCVLMMAPVFKQLPFIKQLSCQLQYLTCHIYDIIPFTLQCNAELSSFYGKRN